MCCSPTSSAAAAAATCNPTIGRERGADAIYDITDPANPRFMSYFKIPRTQNNSRELRGPQRQPDPEQEGPGHPGPVLVPGRPLGDRLDEPKKVKEIAWFDRGPYPTAVPPSPLAGFWSTYYYNGYIYGSEIQRGFDVFELDDPTIKGAGKFKYDTLNAQTQERF